MKGMCLGIIEILLFGLHVQQGLIIYATILLIGSRTTEAPDPDPDPDRELKLSPTLLL